MSFDTAFVLGGGGRWGAVEVGMLQALEESGVRPDLVLGTSIGAFNGSVIADDPGPGGVARLNALWDKVSGADLFRGNALGRVRNVATLQPAIHRSHEMQLILESAFGGPGKHIEDLQIPFQCVGASIQRAAGLVLTLRALKSACLGAARAHREFPLPCLYYCRNRIASFRCN